MSTLRKLVRPKTILLVWAVVQFPLAMWDVWFPEPDGFIVCSFYMSFWQTPFWLALSLILAAAGLRYGKVWGNLLALGCCSDLLYRHFPSVMGFYAESRVFSEDGGIVLHNLLAWWKFLAENNLIYVLQFLTAVALFVYAAVSLVVAVRRPRPSFQ